MTSSFSDKGRVAVLDWPEEISGSEIYDYIRARSPRNVIPISQVKSEPTSPTPYLSSLLF